MMYFVNLFDVNDDPEHVVIVFFQIPCMGSVSHECHFEGMA